MARVTVEDCVVRVPNRFELVMIAAQRSRDISAGSPLTMDRDNDKNPVVALREIADETVSVDVLQEALVRGLQRHADNDEPDEEVVAMMREEQGVVAEAAGAEAGPRYEDVSAEDVEEVSEADEDDDGDEDDEVGADDIEEL